MEGLILVVVLGATILGGGMLAQRIPVPAPLILLLAGAALGFVPALDVELPPELVLLLFLPALLYWESLNTSLREIRDNLRIILLLAVGLVFVTAFAVAWLAASFGLPWPMALALGAILSPTDATAVAAVVRRLPRRQGTILRAESLLNDGTALVLYSVAVGAATAGASITAVSLSAQFVYAYAVGILIGLVIGFAAYQVRKLFHGDRLLSGTLSVLTPFVAYLPAELLGASGVVAVVVCGLVISQVGPRIITAATRAQTLRLLAAGELHAERGALRADRARAAAGAREPRRRVALRPALRARVRRGGHGRAAPLGRHHALPDPPRRPAARCSARGASGSDSDSRSAGPDSAGRCRWRRRSRCPQETASGEPLPGRDLVIAVTFVVILFTLVVQGLTLPAVVRWSGLTRDPREFDEELLGEQAMLRAAIDELPVVGRSLGTSEPVIEGLRASYEDRLQLIHREEGRPEAAVRDGSQRDEEDALHLAILPAKRAALLALRHERRIDDVILRRLQARIDLEELRLSAPPDDD